MTGSAGAWRRVLLERRVLRLIWQETAGHGGPGHHARHEEEEEHVRAEQEGQPVKDKRASGGPEPAEHHAESQACGTELCGIAFQKIEVDDDVPHREEELDAQHRGEAGVAGDLTRGDRTDSHHERHRTSRERHAHVHAPPDGHPEDDGEEDARNLEDRRQEEAGRWTPPARILQGGPLQGVRQAVDHAVVCKVRGKGHVEHDDGGPAVALREEGAQARTRLEEALPEAPKTRHPRRLILPNLDLLLEEGAVLGAAPASLRPARGAVPVAALGLGRGGGPLGLRRPQLVVNGLRQAAVAFRALVVLLEPQHARDHGPCLRDAALQHEPVGALLQEEVCQHQQHARQDGRGRQHGAPLHVVVLEHGAEGPDDCGRVELSKEKSSKSYSRCWNAATADMIHHNGVGRRHAEAQADAQQELGHEQQQQPRGQDASDGENRDAEVGHQDRHAASIVVTGDPARDGPHEEAAEDEAGHGPRGPGGQVPPLDQALRDDAQHQQVGAFHHVHAAAQHQDDELVGPRADLVDGSVHHGGHRALPAAGVRRRSILNVLRPRPLQFPALLHLCWCIPHWPTSSLLLACHAAALHCFWAGGAAAAQRGPWPAAPESPAARARGSLHCA
eukprot:CAMPEP_0175731258 /NCGR_PEP_ID=MMETSP0097-20121207/50747_1 /TAXON_ID=311494 /ORGANISM="Alexandrium monilatum, Strain CCMP3105" /LENGTH=616 /DNA_ID=CAMNT_0017039187 /DNA_START=73 /DNA_END=1923 /DNA_ORIENTATION=-